MFSLKILNLGSGSGWELFAAHERVMCVCVYTNKVKKDLSKSKLEYPSLHRNQIMQKYIKLLIYTLHVKLIDKLKPLNPQVGLSLRLWERVNFKNAKKIVANNGLSFLNIYLSACKNFI